MKLYGSGMKEPAAVKKIKFKKCSFWPFYFCLVCTAPLASIFLVFAIFAHYSSSSHHNFVIMSWCDGETNAKISLFIALYYYF